MSTTILTDKQKAQFVTDIADYGTGFVAPLFAVVEAIEQAVLQSPEVQARMEAYAARRCGRRWIGPLPSVMRPMSKAKAHIALAAIHTLRADATPLS